MAKKPDGAPKGVSVAAMVAAAKEEMGEDIGEIGGKIEDSPRLPIGVLEFDVATGGGFPLNKASIVYGNESASKTVHTALAIASHQRMFPDRSCAYVALEGFSEDDQKWFTALGVDTDKLVVFRPTYAEQVIDIMEGFCWANDAGLIVLDSIAAMMTVTEFESSGEKQSYGGASLPISKMIRKTTSALNKSPSKPTIIYINQVRTKIGVMYGNPVTMPGGAFPKFQSAMTIRLHGKNEMDTKISKTLPVAKHVIATIEKWKVPILAARAEYDLAMVPHKGLRPGQSDWFNTFKGLATEYGILEKATGKGAKGWECFGQNWPTLKELKEELYSQPGMTAAVTSDLIDALSRAGGLLPEDDD